MYFTFCHSLYEDVDSSKKRIEFIKEEKDHLEKVHFFWCLHISHAYCRLQVLACNLVIACALLL